MTERSLVTYDTEITGHTWHRDHWSHMTERSLVTYDTEITGHTWHRDHWSHMTQRSLVTYDTEITGLIWRRNHWSHMTQRSLVTHDTEVTHWSHTPQSQFQQFPMKLITNNISTNSTHIPVKLKIANLKPINIRQYRNKNDHIQQRLCQITRFHWLLTLCANKNSGSQDFTTGGPEWNSQPL